jgi:signal transduction histidine kinase
VTHELKTPVAAIRAAVELLEDGPLAPDDRRLLGQIDGARQQMEAQLAALRDTARARETRYLGQCRLSDLHPALAAAHPGLALHLSGGDHPLPLAPDGMALVLGHLLRNAAENGATEVTLHTEPDRLTVQDNGPGLSCGNADRAFEPFFTTRRDTGGTGMGLTLVSSLLQAHRATITLQPSQGGATFRIGFARAAG